MILTYKYRLKGKRAGRQLRRFAFAANQVWNFCVQTQKATQRAWRGGLSPKWLSHFDLQRLSSGVSSELGLNAQSIQGVCAQFAKSRNQHKKCPAFRKSSGSKRSLGWIPFTEQARQTTPGSVTYLGNTYKFFGANRRPLPSNAKGGCFVEDARGYWYVCFYVEVEDLPSAPAKAVGIDLGLKTLATLSTGEKIEGPRAYRLWEEKLIKAQRANDRDRVRAINTKIANIRRDHMHKATTRLAEEFNEIYVGDVSSSRLVQTPMAKSVLDAGWSTFRSTLEYKVSRHQGKYLEVDEKFSSQTCSSCEILPASRPRGIAGLEVRSWVCSECSARHDRDVNAAKNILRVGRSATPLVEESRVVHGHQPEKHDSQK
jgi:putative transposase